MGKRLHALIDIAALKLAAHDFRYLLNRNYPRRAALTLVGNRYQLSVAERDLLHRGVFARKNSERKNKKIPISALYQASLAIDGHNVLITLESALRGLPLILADDGFIRDIARAGRGYVPGAFTMEALNLISDTLRRHRPADIIFLLDSPVSKSGELAATARRFLSEYGLKGRVQAIPVPEKILSGFPGAVATSDSAIIEDAAMVFDLAGHIIRYRLGFKNMIRFR
ncbi:MAG: DUF434 domain-containing protein [Thermodesulfobacteriota bacterium]|nr:DUF434 domain-containing protein [Thermodesulfobacteriota bacterium]